MTHKRGPPGRHSLPGSSQVMVYDFATGKVSLPLQRAMNDNGVRTLTEGLFTQLPRWVVTDRGSE